MIPRLVQTNKIPLKMLLKRTIVTVPTDSVHPVQDLEQLRPLSEMPSPPGWPIVGHLPFMMKKETQTRLDRAFNKFREQYGDIYRLILPGLGDMVAIFRPEDIKTLYAKEALYTKEGRTPIVPAFINMEIARTTTMKDRYTTSGLLTNNQDWYETRHMVQQDMMRPKSALYYIQDIAKFAGELAEKIDQVKDKDGMLNPLQVLHEYAAEVVGSVFMGAHIGALEGKEDGKRLVEIQQQSWICFMQLFLLPPKLVPYHPSYKKYVTLMTENFDICKKYVDEAIARVDPTDESVIARLVRKCGKESPIPLIMGIDALQVGIDTTGSSAVFLLYHLAANPEKQEKLYQEIIDTIGEDGGVTESKLVKMQYLKACQKESQRLLPAVFGMIKYTTQDMVLSGYQVPAGTLVFRSSSTSVDSANFSDPEKFLPERWLRESPCRHTAHAFANIPFGHGVRSCIGQRFAKLELYMLMVKVVQKFHMEFRGEEFGVFTHAISVPNKPVNIKFTRR